MDNILNSKKMDTKSMEDSHALAALSGVAAAYFWWTPRTFPGVCLFLLCCGIGYQYLAPSLIFTLKFFSSQYISLGFLNTDQNTSLTGICYIIAIFGSYPAMVILGHVFTIIAPKWIVEKFDGSEKS